MGESLVEVPKVENKMGETIGHVPCLQQSVSFGRFESDSLCWERWSSFPTNKYLEEVEKFSTPGSVAQKKAYFEAHYKKIAAKKLELMEQERVRETEIEDMADHSLIVVDSVCINSMDDHSVEQSHYANSVAGPKLDQEAMGCMGDVNIEHIAVPSDCIENNNDENEVEVSTSGSGELVDEPIDAADVIDKHEDPEDQHLDAIADVCPVLESPELEKPEESVEVKEVIASTLECPDRREEALDKVQPEICMKDEALSTLESQDKEELPQEIKTVKKKTEGQLKAKNSKKMQKAMPIKKATSTTDSKKKVASPMPKRSAAPMPQAPMLSTPKTSKSVLSKSVMSSTRPAVKKENGLTPVTSKKTARPDSKKVLPTSPHMSLSLAPVNSNPAAPLTTTRRSLIMEQMGDKDIVKRAFKTFQNSSYLSPSSVTRTPATNQSATKKIEQKGSVSDTPKSKLEGITKAVKPSSSLTGRQGTVKASISTGLQKTALADLKNSKSTPPSLGLREDKGIKQKEVPTILEQKSKRKEAGKTHQKSNAMVEKPAALRKPSESTNMKVKLSSSLNLGHGKA